MIKELIKNTSTYFPLMVNSLAWDHTTLRLMGEGWDFSTTCSWRIVVDSTLNYACYDSEVLEALKKLENNPIIAIEIQSKHLPVDPVFVFPNGYKLEVFTTARAEPWTFRSPSGTLYIADFS
jgi:hypothetical protein